MLGGQIRSPDDFEEGDFRKFAPRFSPENFPKNLKLVDRITDTPSRKNRESWGLGVANIGAALWGVRLDTSEQLVES